MSADAVYHDRDSVHLPDRALLRVADAIARLPWTPMLCPTMPHQYVVSGWREILPADLAAILAMIRDSPDTRLAYWRGYQSPTRYWHGPDGFRYWTSPAFNPAEFVINRTDEVDDTRPVDEGGQPFPDWEGCPWEPQGSHVYERRQVEGRWGWWPSAAALAAGYKPCRACQRRPVSSWSKEEQQLLGSSWSATAHVGTVSAGSSMTQRPMGTDDRLGNLD